MFELRRSFMESLNEKIPGSTPISMVDLSSKEDQQICRDVALRGVEEMFEALQHLKNWKPHRQTEVSGFDRDKFLEEMVDAFNYFFSLLIMTGFDADDLFKEYLRKDEIIHKRLEEGY
jgi:dimeric dUTPase (all-alpha-NTP-PPase superfamily)